METLKTESIANIGTRLTPDAVSVIRQIAIPSYGVDIRKLIADPVLRNMSNITTSVFLETAYLSALPASYREYAGDLRLLVSPTKELMMELSRNNQEIKDGILAHLERQTPMTSREYRLLYTMGGAMPTKHQEQWWSNAFWCVLSDGSY